MRNIAVKYGLVIGIFLTVFTLLLCWLAPTVASGLLPYGVAFGISFGLMLIYNITKRNELQEEEHIAYHQAFINSFLMGFIGLLMFTFSFAIAKSWVFPNIPETQKQKTIERYDLLIANYKNNLSTQGTEAAEQLGFYMKQKEVIAKEDFKPFSDTNTTNTIISAISLPAIATALMAIITAFFGCGYKLKNKS